MLHKHPPPGLAQMYANNCGQDMFRACAGATFAPIGKTSEMLAIFCRILFQLAEVRKMWRSQVGQVSSKACQIPARCFFPKIALTSEKVLGMRAIFRAKSSWTWSPSTKLGRSRQSWATSTELGSFSVGVWFIQATPWMAFGPSPETWPRVDQL